MHGEPGLRRRGAGDHVPHGDITLREPSAGHGAILVSTVQDHSGQRHQLAAERGIGLLQAFGHAGQLLVGLLQGRIGTQGRWRDLGGKGRGKTKQQDGGSADHRMTVGICA